MSKVKTIKFDMENRFLIGFGDNSVFVMDLQTQPTFQSFDLNNLHFETILDAQLRSFADDDYTLLVASKRVG